ncbi:MAG: alpha/beta hydrolase [Desulfobacterales bacterium]
MTLETKNTDALSLTCKLLGFNAINPPGHEHDCAKYVGGASEYALKTKLFILMSLGLSLLSAIFLAGCFVDNQSAPKVQNHVKGFNDSPAIRTDDDFVCWFNAETSDKKTGVALVIHGLNLRPGKMESIISLLAHYGMDVLNVSLRGHGQNFTQKEGVDIRSARMDAFKTVSYQLWIDETHRAYRLAKKRSDEKNVPLFFIGFSMGGLMGADLFASYPDVCFDKMVLFAPAFKLHGITYFGKLLSPFPRLVIPTLASTSYLTNSGTPMAAYNALFEAVRHFNKNIHRKLNIPTIILIDKKDELVSYQGLRRMVEKENLDQWKFHLIQKGQIDVKEKMNHLIIDEPSVGKDIWNEIQTIIIKHLLL